MVQPQWLQYFDPKLTLPLLLIILFLIVIAIGNLFGLYKSVVEGNTQSAFLALLPTLLYAVPAYGLFKLKRWARLIEIAFSFILVALGLFMVFSGLFDESLFPVAVQGILIIIIHGSIAFYLLGKTCRKAFGYEADITK